MQKRFGLVWAVLCATAATSALAKDQVPDPKAPPVPETHELPVAMLVDVTSNQVLYARNAQRRFVPASVTKVMTLYCAFEMIRNGELAPNAMLTASEETALEWSGKGSSMWLRAGDEVPVSQLLTGIATVSANDASIVLARQAGGSVAEWSARMNDTARTLGMTQSHFNTPNGFPDEGRTFTTARDLVTLADAVITRHPTQYARFIGREQFRYRNLVQDNRDPILGRVEGADGIKTGYTSEAGFTFLGSAKRDEQRLVVVVAGASRNSVRARAARDLLEWGFSAFELAQLFEKGDIVSAVQVQDGNARRLALVADRDVRVNVPYGSRDKVRMSVHYDGPLRAPIAGGDEVATLVVEAPDMEPARIPLLATRDVAKAAVFERIGNAIAHWWERFGG